MTLSTQEPVRPAEAAASTEPPQVLFPEAENYQRHRRRRFATVLTVLVLAVGAILATAVTRSSPSPYVNARTFARDAVAATESAKTAKVVLTFETQPTRTAGCVRLPQEQLRKQPITVTTDQGVVNFSPAEVALDETYADCGGSGKPFCAIPRQMIFTTTALYTATKHQGTTCYSVATSKKPHAPKKTIIINGPPAPKPWNENSVNVAEFVGVNDVLMSAEPLRVVDALNGRVKRIGTSEINGVATTKYVGNTTLAAIQRLDDYHPVLTPKQGSLAPAGSRIRVSEAVWLDSDGRIVKLVVIEPLYRAIQPSGAGELGATQVFSTMVANGGSLSQKNFDISTVELTDFNGAEAIVVPKPSEVTKAK